VNTLVPMVSEVVDFHYCYEDYGPPDGREQASPLGLHVHPFYQLDLFPEGGTTIFIDDRPPLRSKVWSGLLIPPMTGHSYSSERTALQVTFKFHVHPRYWLNFGKTDRLILFPAMCEELIQGVRDLSRADPFLHKHHTVAVITACLVHWLRHSGPHPVHEVDDPWSHRIRSSIEKIAENPDAPWSVADLACQCHVSPDHFRRRFMAIVGRSPRRFLLEFRMRTAAAYLLNEDIAIKEAAAKVGYSSVHAFSRAFKNVFGTSPAAYLANLPRHW
jgi:AraC-like DNA-binding protein